MSLLPTTSLQAILSVLEYGASKYTVSYTSSVNDLLKILSDHATLNKMRIVYQSYSQTQPQAYLLPGHPTSLGFRKKHCFTLNDFNGNRISSVEANSILDALQLFLEDKIVCQYIPIFNRYTIKDIVAEHDPKYSSVSYSISGEGNWEQGMTWSRCYNSCMRHLLAFWRGEEMDPESGLPHLAHAICNIIFLYEYQTRSIGKDDR
jgi:hypothetical protein